MASCHQLTLCALLLVAFLSQFPARSLACSTVVSYGGAQQVYARCQDLPSQGAVLAYTYSPVTLRLSLAFSGTATSPAGWVGWGINPTSRGMAGSSVLVAFQAANGSNVLPFMLTEATEGGSPLVCTPVDLNVLSRAVEISGPQMTIFATLQLGPGQTYLNMVWNRGASVRGFSPQRHSLLPADLRGFTSMNVAM